MPDEKRCAAAVSRREDASRPTGQELRARRRVRLVASAVTAPASRTNSVLRPRPLQRVRRVRVRSATAATVSASRARRSRTTCRTVSGAPMASSACSATRCRAQEDGWSPSVGRSRMYRAVSSGLAPGPRPSRTRSRRRRIRSWIAAGSSPPARCVTTTSPGPARRGPATEVAVVLRSGHRVLC